MPSPGARERLQPSLLDRLEDDLGPAIEQLRSIRRVLESTLYAAQAQALQALLADERLIVRQPGVEELAPFATLTSDLRGLVNDAIRLERHRRIEQQRVFVISAERLRAACLHDLQCLFNETSVTALLPSALAGETPAVCASVLAYGLPAIAGGMRTPEQFAALARDIARAITVFEPRIRNVRVTLDARPDRLGADGLGRVGYVIEGELWGYPFDERLYIRTLLDLDLGRFVVQDGAAA